MASSPGEVYSMPFNLEMMRLPKGENPHTEKEQSVAGPDTQSLCVQEEASVCLLRVFNAPNAAPQAPPLASCSQHCCVGDGEEVLLVFTKRGKLELAD